MKEKSVKELIYYAEKKLSLGGLDVRYYENLLLGELGCSAPYEGEIDKKAIDEMERPDAIVESLTNDLKEDGLEQAEIDRKIDRLFGLVSPSPSLVAFTFNFLKSSSSEKAAEYLYDLAIKNNYLKKTLVERNLVWEADYETGVPLTITVNLTKPEKDNKEIAKMLSLPNVAYPKCALCEENLGYYGDHKTPPRSTIRFVPLKLNGEDWYLQYSPYGYYDHHLIVFKKEHVPMCISHKTIGALLDFVEQFPQYFLGSNSDLPIVGGSILSHEHYQGGTPLLPIFKADDAYIHRITDKGTRVSVLSFYDSSIRVKGLNKEDVYAESVRILETWKAYDDEKLGIHHNDGAPHNTVTPYARRVGDEYEVTMILRNNEVSEKYPDGIYHAHPEYHAIKKEGIGLIESAGLFILPARLKRQLKEVEDTLSLSQKEAERKYPDLKDFATFISMLKEKNLTPQEGVNVVCREILRNVAVYKDDDTGRKGLLRFLERVYQ